MEVPSCVDETGCLQIVGLVAWQSRIFPCHLRGDEGVGWGEGVGRVRGDLLPAIYFMLHPFINRSLFL
jgi:hypothetical protein